MDDLRSGTATAAQLQDLLVHHEDVLEFLQHLARLSSSSLSSRGMVYCGITLQRSRELTFTVASSDSTALEMDEMQYAFDDGPCLHALRVHEPVHVPDTSRDERWPEYLKHVVAQGVNTMYAVPLDLEGHSRAALNLYSRSPGVFDEEFQRVARTYAAEASLALRLAVRMSQRATTVEDLQAVLQSRTDIDLAIGIIMGQNRCTQHEAFETLKRASNSRNLKLKVLAGEMVARLNGAPSETHFQPS
ncbi:GAF and ANTAR domain-containing protein [Arthrobacter sp. Sa2BUA2]|uniref:GAF and ANTAR domain-containing protein n=1 Tax=Arthrobacter pullicola TaxID=2762224 RepID=A0ABR8YE86_9MICC|nr:GAF and ANTAR domain-containing protein [Arthrobacter pullicola]MBD8042540.1 GAF and ANTAR domain-containing protein [Arthrobacter pullicola]